MRHKKRVKRLYKWETVQKERRALYRYFEQEGLEEVEKAFASGALFALEWMQNRRRSAPSKYLVWLKDFVQHARCRDWRTILQDMGSAGYRP